MKKFILKQKKDIELYGTKELLRKLNLLFKLILQIPLYLIAIIPCIVIRLLRPWIIIRIEAISAGNYGNFADDPALYYCKKKLNIDQLNKKHIDLTYIRCRLKVYNRQLAKMWKRKLNFFPGYLLEPINVVNRFFPGWKIHSIPDLIFFSRRSHCNIGNIGHKIEKCKALEFTHEEEIYGKNLLNRFGLKNGDKFVCLAVRDSAYQLKKIPSRFQDWSYHDYRHWNLDNFFLAAEELTKKGYYVFRMGVVAEKKFKSNNPKIIDYVNSNLRNDFMDVFLGAKCSFCISTGLGFDAVPNIFRKPIILLILPFGNFRSHSDRYLILTKHHYSKKEKRRLTLSEIFSCGAAFSFRSKDFEQKEVELIDNTSEEIKDVVIEMAEYLEKKNNLNKEEEELQKTFKNLYSYNMFKYGHQLFQDFEDNFSPRYTHENTIKSRFSTKFLKENRDWLR